MEMLLRGASRRTRTLTRVVALILVDWSVAGSHHHPAASGRGLLVGILVAVCTGAWLLWGARAKGRRAVLPELYVLAGAGGVLCGASPNNASSTFVFAAVVAAALRNELRYSAIVGILGTGCLAISTVVYGGSGLGLLAYSLGFAAAALAASNARQASQRAEQAELLLAQAQRSQEEQLRSAQLRESTRIAREIHDLLAHTLAGLTIQLEATGALLDQGAGREQIVERIGRAHELAAEGLRETRRAVGALRGEEDSEAPSALARLVAEYETTADAPARLDLRGRPERLCGATGEAVVRVVQEALTNVYKHAWGAEVEVTVDAGADRADAVVAVVTDRPRAMVATAARRGLALSGGGFGIRGMRERAEELGGTLAAGQIDGGWRVELRLPAPDQAQQPTAPAG